MLQNLTTVGFSGKVSESQVALIWQRQLLAKNALATEDGQPLEIIYPGRPNDDRGADFRDAVISANHNLLRGDIELHVRSSDWHSHGHDLDDWYNNVILHVVMWHNSPRATTLQNGREVPVLALEKYVTPGAQCPDSYLPLAQGPPCLQATPETVAKLLDEAGEARFLAKADRFRDRLLRADAAQVLFAGMMEALGYAKNSQPFLELAGKLPLKALESVTLSRFSDKDCLSCLQGLLLAAAGLKTGLTFATSMSPQSWNTFKIRPQNSPVRRIQAISHLLVRYRGKGLLDELTGKLIAQEGRQRYDILEKAFIVVAAGQSGRSLTLLGRERAAAIVINVLLPFSYTWGQLTGWPELSRKALALYRDYPARAMNSVERHMISQLGLDCKLADTALRQQGLLHIYKNLCIQGKCGECALSQPHSGQHVHV